MVQLDFPPGAVSETTVITYTEQLTPTEDFGHLSFAGTSFQISATNVERRSLSVPLTMSVTYADSDWQEAGIYDERSLNLYKWNNSAWRSLAESQHDIKDNWFTLTWTLDLNHVHKFVLLGRREEAKIYLPIMNR